MFDIFAGQSTEMISPISNMYNCCDYSVSVDQLIAACSHKWLQTKTDKPKHICMDPLNAERVIR